MGPPRLRVRPHTNVTHGEFWIIDKPVACVEPSFGIDAQITGAGAAGQGAMGAAMNLVERCQQIAKRVGPAGFERGDGFLSAFDHVNEMTVEIRGSERQAGIGRNQHRGKTYIVKAEIDHMVEKRQQSSASGRHGCTSGELTRLRV